MARLLVRYAFSNCRKVVLLPNANVEVCRRMPNLLGISTSAIRLTTAAQAGAAATDFEAAKQRLNLLKEDPDSQTKLQLYALFKQSTVGKCNAKRPGMTDFIGKAKWDAWNALSNLSQSEAQQKYVKLINDLCVAQGVDVTAVEKSGGVKMSPAAAEGDVKVEVKDGVSIITLNRPTKKNALKFEMYHAVADALSTCAKDSSTITVLTGAGDYFCSGNDLSNFMDVTPGNMPQKAKEGQATLQKFVGSLIDYPKPLIALVNGPAVGISVTILGLFDAVFATERATFYTPFSSLGQSPEGCSSYTFPKIMGSSKALEMLLFNRRLTAAEASERGLVTEVFPDHFFQRDAWKKVYEFAKLPKNSLRLSKALVRDVDRAALHDANKRECELLTERWQSDECINAIMNFFQQKSKL